MKQALERLANLGKCHATLTPDRENYAVMAPDVKMPQHYQFWLFHLIIPLPLDTQAYKQFGNAVTVTLFCEIAKSIKTCIEQGKGENDGERK